MSPCATFAGASASGTPSTNALHCTGKKRPTPWYNQSVSDRRVVVTLTRITSETRSGCACAYAIDRVDPHEPPIQAPTVDAEMLAKPLHVGDQVLGCVDRHVRGRGGRVRRAPATAALVEHDSEVVLRIERLARSEAGARTRTAMDVQHRLAERVADDLPVDAIAVADIQQS